MASSPETISEVDGWPVNVANMDQAVADICSAAGRRESFAAFTLNLDHLVKLRHDKAFRLAYRAARFVTADGAPVAYLASRNGRKVARTTGADLILPLAKAASDHALSIYLFGTTPETLEAASHTLSQISQGRLRIAGAVSPPFGFDPTGDLADMELARIKASGAHLCLVALSPPKGEVFAARGVERGVDTGFVCVGAALDFLSGRQVRAPQVFQKAGVEWIWRLARDPRRLTVRYAKCAALLAGITAQSIRQSLSPRHPA